MMERRTFLGGCLGVCAVSTVGSVNAQEATAQQPSSLTNAEAAFISRRAEQREVMYRGFARFFSQPENLEDLQETVLPDHEDMITNLFPGSQLISAYDVYSTVKSVREADRQSRFIRTMDAGPRTSNWTPGDAPPDAAEEAYNENHRLSNAAANVADEARSFANGNADREAIEDALRAERERANASGDGSDMIRTWGEIIPNQYGLGNTDPDMAQKIGNAANQNVDALSLSIEQMNRHLDAIDSTSVDVLHKPITGILNNNIDRIPSLVRGEFGSTKMNIHITRPEDSATIVYVETDDGEVKNIQTGANEGAAYKMELPSNELQAILLSGTPGERFKQGLMSNEITYTGRNIFSSVKSTILDGVIDLVGGFL